ncbi:Stk1 family PASTA domain-containing Ser/Thr kinase [Microbacterium gorillae]|uniref:Stk1 family PASTA domain-containing Ser/Thr kinase n=1 Tax=Microbacterium gorillae TaxID=1231063 RepID=UPI000AA6F9AA|nr:Stk1 family PASTA domain-containing Ser/Thr kinase [Microbacterium gorillae]
MSVSEQSRVLSDRYRIDEMIGRGGMATVYRGYDVTLGRTVAIKILNADLARDNVFRTRFRMEAQAASRMANPTIVRVYDAGEDASTPGAAPTPYIVMELVSGRTLKQVIADGAVPVTDALHYVDGILEALEYSHRAGVVHRDIKPGNVMITDDGRVKVMDFGIARAVSDSSSTVAETTSIIGTAAYFSPEQAKGDPVDARTDLYSTGVVLYELLAGRQPFRGDSPVAVAYQHVSETPVAPSEVVTTVPRQLDAVVLRALAKDPYSRFPDAATFRAAIAGAQEGRTPTKRQLDSLTNELYGANPRAAAETARSLRQLSTDNTMTRTQQGPPVAWIWLGVAIIATLIVAVVFWVVTISRVPDPTSTAAAMPDIVNVDYDKAAKDLEAAGLVPVRVDEASPTIKEGNVVRTDPVAGTTVEDGESVNVVVSTGVQKAVAPKLVGLASADATAALAKAGLALGRIDNRNDPNTAANIVLEASEDDGSSVSEGEELLAGATINLVVASGKVTVENVGGFTVEAATTKLTDPETMGLTVTTKNDTNPDCSKGTVTGQDKIGDVPIHSTVELTVCPAG